LDTTKIKNKNIGNFKASVKNGITVDKNKLNGNFMDRLNDMLHKSSAADKLKAVEKIAGNTVKLGFEKAVAHFENPALYPLPQGEKNLESAVFDLLSVLPKKKRNKLIDKVNELLKAPAEKRTQVYGDIVNVDFRSAVSIAEQVKNKPELKKYSFTEKEIEEFNSAFKTLIANSNLPQPQQAASAGTLGFFVDSMTCLNPDDAFKDEVSLGGFLIDSVGNTIDLAPRFIGKFRKNETVSLGANNKLFTVTIDPALQQQTFSAKLFIIESDLVSNLDVLEKTILVFSIISVTLLVAGIAIIIAGALGAAVTVNALLAAWISGLGVNLISHYILPLLGDDISNISTDTLFLDGRIEIGTEFTRTIEIGKGFDFNSTFDGKYTAAARWVGEN